MSSSFVAIPTLVERNIPFREIRENECVSLLKCIRYDRDTTCAAAFLNFVSCLRKNVGLQ